MDYRKAHDAIVSRARARSDVGAYVERHHVVPKSLGGADEASNIVALTYREHFLVHWLLTKITEGAARRKMLHALKRMAGAHSGRIVAAWQYAIGRRAQRDAKLGTKQSAEFIASVSARMKGNQYGRGVTLTEDQIKARRDRLKGNKHSLGYKHTEETLQKRRGQKKSSETRARMSAAGKLRWQTKPRPPFSDEVRAKMSAAVRSRPPISDETRRKLSEASKAQWAARKAGGAVG